MCRRLLALFCLAAIAGTAAGRADGLPAGWQLQADELVWTSRAPLRMGGARYEFRSGRRLLGYPHQSGDSLRLRRAPKDSLADLSVWAAGRRIDVTSPLARIARAEPPAEPAIALAAADPGMPGPYRTERLRYALPGLTIPDLPEPVEVLAEVTAPADDIGPLPLVLFLHGRHSTCYIGGPDGEPSGDWPCPEGWRPVPSHTGYRYIADVLASQGYLTVSVAANGINGQDGLFADGGASARSELVRHHLALWSQWSSDGGDPWGGHFRGRVDLGNVVLVGHSRGGEGVERATIDTNPGDPWKIQGLVLIGPTAFGRQVAAGVHTTVILPFCDGDVSDLQGQQYVDIGRSLTTDPALRSSVMAMGTNHNFYNTEWTPGLSKSPAWDDWFDPDDRQCGENRDRRLTPVEQQSVGLAYTSALVELAIGGDARSRRLLDGTRVKPRSIGRASVSVHAIGGGKRLLFAAGKGADVTARSLQVRDCRGYFFAGPFDLRSGCAQRFFFDVLPHWIPMSFAETAPAPRALDVRWTSPGGSLRIPVQSYAGGADALDLRMAGVPGAAPVEFDVRVRDASGRWTKLGERPLKLRSYFGPSPLGKVVARELRAPLSRIGGITAIEIVPRTASGRFWLLDVSAWEDRLPRSDPIHLPKASVGDVTVREGDAGSVRLDVPITIEGEVKKTARLWAQLTDYANFEHPISGLPIVIEPGTTSATIPVTYPADDAYSPFPQLIQVTLLAQRNIVTGDFDGSALVEEDDPAPVLAVDSRSSTAAEGSSLTWTFRLSEPMTTGALWPIEFLPPTGLELDSDDVPPDFLERFGIVPPRPAVPLSQLGIFLDVEFAPGAQVATVLLPLAQDGIAEGSERVALRLDGFGDPVVPAPIDLAGRVPGTVSP
jgi:hypothetical protein